MMYFLEVGSEIAQPIVSFHIDVLRTVTATYLNEYEMLARNEIIKL